MPYLKKAAHHGNVDVAPAHLLDGVAVLVGHLAGDGAEVEVSVSLSS